MESQLCTYLKFGYCRMRRLVVQTSVCYTHLVFEVRNAESGCTSIETKPISDNIHLYFHQCLSILLQNYELFKTANSLPRIGKTLKRLTSTEHALRSAMSTRQGFPAASGVWGEGDYTCMILR